MTRILWSFLAALLLGVLLWSPRATGSIAIAATPAPPPVCSMNQTSVSPLFVNYDPTSAPVSGTVLTVNGGTLTFTCSGLGSGNAGHVHIFVSGSNAASYAPPFLSGPNGFQLNYNLCVPGSTGGCSASTNLWNKTTEYKVTSGINGLNTIPGFSIFIPRQDAYVGALTDYTGTLYFSFNCGEPVGTAC